MGVLYLRLFSHRIPKPGLVNSHSLVSVSSVVCVFCAHYTLKMNTGPSQGLEHASKYITIKLNPQAILTLKQCVVKQTYNPSVCCMSARNIRNSRAVWVHCEFEVSLSYRRPYLKTKVIFFFFKDRVSLCSLDVPGTCFAD